MRVKADIIISISLLYSAVAASVAKYPLSAAQSRNITLGLFTELEELARIVDISYCVGTSGIQEPFQCLSRCSSFPDFNLVTTWNTGPLLSDSCGYIATSESPPRIIVAFRGTYSLANTVVDLSTIPQEYEPYPDEPSGGPEGYRLSNESPEDYANVHKCANCTVHSGFLLSWRHTRDVVLPHLELSIKENPHSKLVLVGHSLGGAVAALAGLEFEQRGWKPTITTFGEPRLGNKALMEHMDMRFNTSSDENVGIGGRYRRVTHVNDPIPLLPLEEWGYRMHAGEIYISKAELSPAVADLEICEGDEDPNCIASTSPPALQARSTARPSAPDHIGIEWWSEDGGMWTVPKRFRMWQLFFAHRDYFWRLGLCVPGGDPEDWWRKYPNPHNDLSNETHEKVEL